jgi:phospholipid/cholesterol/gamma-HCH transport system substrate-binding protein
MKRTFRRPSSHQPSQATVIIAMLAALALIGFFVDVAWNATRGFPGVGYYDLNAAFSNTSEIGPDAQVRVAGRLAGDVLNVTYNGRQAIVHLQLYGSERYLRSSTTARIRTRNLLALQYIELTPGRHGRPLRNGATIPESNTSTAVDIDGLLEAFPAPARQHAQQTVQGLGAGFLGRGQDLNLMLGQAPAVLQRLNLLSESILARTGAAQRFAPSAESLVGAYDPVRQQLASGFDPEARALQPFADQRPATQHTLEQAPPSLTALRHALDAATPLLNETARFAAATRALTEPAPAALRQASVLLREGRPALARTRPLLDALNRAVSPTLGFLQRFEPVISPTTQALADQLPLLTEFARYSCDIQSWGVNWRSALGYGVPPGTNPVGALAPSEALDQSEGIGPLNSFRALAVIPSNLETVQETLNSDSEPLLGGPLAQDAYPAPCQATQERIR